MEKRRFIPAAVLIVFVLCCSIASAGEKAVYDRDYNLRYHIDDSGRIYDRDYNRKGRVEGNKVYDENYKLKYRIEGDKVYDRDWNLKYRRDGDRIYDRNYNLKGIQVGMTYLRTSLHPPNTAGTATGYMTGTIT